MAATAILDQELDQVLGAVEIGAVANDPAIALRLDQAGALQNGQVARQGALGDVQVVGQVAGGNRIRRKPDELPEDFQARFLGQGAKCRQGLLWFHISRIIDRNKTVKSAKYEGCVTGV